jgi:hypothetical protein
MSNFDILEIEVDEQDLVDVPERLVIFRSDSEDKEESAKRRKVQMEMEKVGDPSDLSTKVPAESVAIQAASSSTPETSAALLTARKFVSRIKRYKQRISIVHPIVNLSRINLIGVCQELEANARFQLRSE